MNTTPPNHQIIVNIYQPVTNETLIQLALDFEEMMENRHDIDEFEISYDLQKDD